MLIIDYSLDMFRASVCPSSGEKTTCYCIWGIFAGSVGCGKLRYCGAHTLQRSTTVPQLATSNTTSKYTPYAVTRGLFS